MKNSRILRRIQVLLGFLIITSCGGNKDSGEKEEVILDPTKAVLVYPDNNEESDSQIETFVFEFDISLSQDVQNSS